MFSMFKKKKKQKLVISIPSDVRSDILRYFSRTQLCKQIYLVNRKLYDLANSRHNVPTTHVISITYFKTDERPRTFLNIFKQRQYNCVRFGSYDYSKYPNHVRKTLDTKQLIKMPIPKPFVRFQTVFMYRLLGESTLKFLRDAKESFVGSVIHYSMDNILYNKDMRNQMHYLFQNVFLKPSYICVRGSCLRLSELKVLTDGLPNCSRMKLNISCYVIVLCQSDEDTIRMSLDWLSSDKSVVQSSQRDTVEKHLVLDYLNRKSILDLVQQIKDAFIGDTLLFSDFVITFSSSYGNRLCLEDDHTFTLNKMTSNERLSFFTHNQFERNDSGFGCAYRLWCRRVVSEHEDLKMATHLQNLSDWSRLGIDLEDYDFYHFDYPIADLKVFTDGLPNCSRMKIRYGAVSFEDNVRDSRSDEGTIRMILDWIIIGKDVAQNSQKDTVKKHLLLRNLPRKIIIDMVQQIKNVSSEI